MTGASRVPSPEAFTAAALANPANAALLQRLPQLALPDAWLVAGCLFQAVWNARAGRDPAADVKDYDVFYFDASDLSEAAEAAHQARADALFADLGMPIEVKNQARVHTWYPEYFGHPYAPLTSSRDGIERFLVECTCVGLQPCADGRLALCAPYGLDDLFAGLLRPNALMNHPELFAAKVQSYRFRWPSLRWDQGEFPGSV